MPVLRSTNHQYHQQGTTVALNVSHLKHGAIQLLYSWLEIWLFRHCRSGWAIEVTDSTLSIRFDDVREAVYFKLSPEYLKHHA